MASMDFEIKTTDGNGCCHPSQLELWCKRCPERPVATTNSFYPFTKTLPSEPTLMKLSVLAEEHEEEAHGG